MPGWKIIQVLRRPKKYYWRARRYLVMFMETRYYIYIFVPWFVQTDQSDCSIRGVYISYTPPKRVYIFCLRSRPPISRYTAKPPKRFRSKENKVIIGRNNKVNFTSKSYMTAGIISERILADKLLARVVVNSYC